MVSATDVVSPKEGEFAVKHSSLNSWLRKLNRSKDPQSNNSSNSENGMYLSGYRGSRSPKGSPCFSVLAARSGQICSEVVLSRKACMFKGHDPKYLDSGSAVWQSGGGLFHTGWSCWAVLFYVNRLGRLYVNYNFIWFQPEIKLAYLLRMFNRLLLTGFPVTLT